MTRSETSLILITRFSWPHPVWESRSDSDYALWLENRFSLFETFTARSVVNCYVKPDYWVLLTGSNQHYVHERLSATLEASGCRYILAPYCGLPIALTVMNACRELSYPASIVTTNLDADDVISSDFFAVLKGISYPSAGNMTVSFCSGSNYMPDQDVYYHSSYPDNPFMSLYETCRSAHEAQTVFFRMHTEISQHVSSRVYPRTYYPMWASVIHGGNLANNSLIETNRVSFKETGLLHRRFGIHP